MDKVNADLLAFLRGWPGIDLPVPAAAPPGPGVAR
jgi:hypothetical protein